MEYLCWLRPFHTAKNCSPATCIRATVTPNRSLFGKPPGTSLKISIIDLRSELLDYNLNYWIKDRGYMAAEHSMD